MTSTVVLSGRGRAVQSPGPWWRFQVGPHISHGIVEDDTVIEVSASPFGEHTVTRTMGTEGADGDLVPGDVIEVEISDIGTLRNYVVAED